MIQAIDKPHFGGLNIRLADHMIESLLAKMGWKYLVDDSLLTRYMKDKYGIANYSDGVALLRT